MRIVAGTRRGKTLVSPKGETTRPTHERTREAVFGSLQLLVPGARVLDCFAGSGAMALEALSRGAAWALLLERDGEACKTIEENIRLTGMEDRAELRRGDALESLAGLRNTAFDLALLDPPYGQGLIERALALLALEGRLAEGAVLVAETAAGEALELPKGYCLWKERKYGKNLVRFLRFEGTNGCGAQEGRKAEP